MSQAQPVKGCLVDVVDGSRLEFQFNPDNISDNKETNIGEIRIPGRSHPRYQFVSGERREISFKLEFFKVPDLKTKVKWLQSLQYPTHAGTILQRAPHKVLFVFGTLFNLTCLVKTVKARFFQMFDLQLEPERAEVDIVLWEDVENSIGPSEVRA